MPKLPHRQRDRKSHPEQAGGPAFGPDGGGANRSIGDAQLPRRRWTRGKKREQLFPRLPRQAMICTLESNKSAHSRISILVLGLAWLDKDVELCAGEVVAIFTLHTRQSQREGLRYCSCYSGTRM